MDLISAIIGAVVGLVAGLVIGRIGRGGASAAEERPDSGTFDGDADRDEPAGGEGSDPEAAQGADGPDADESGLRLAEVEEQLEGVRGELGRAREEAARSRRWIEARYRRLAQELAQEWADAKLPSRVDQLADRSRPPAKARVERMGSLATQLQEWSAELDLSSAEAAHQLGLWHAFEERSREAADCFQEATSKGMGIEAWLALGDCLWALDRREKAADAYSHCLRNDSMPPHAAWRYAEVCFERRQPKEAMSALEPTLGRRDLPIEVVSLASRAAAKLGQDERAVEILEQGLEAHPDSVRLQAEMVIPLDRGGDRKKAEQVAARAAKLDPQAAEVPFALGVVHLAHAELPKAQERFEEALRLRPEYPQALYCLGVVHNRKRRFKKALGVFEKAVEIRPDYAEAWYAMKDSYEGLKKFDEAIAALEKATKLNPDFE